MKITLLTQEACDFCAQAKEVLARLGHEYSFELELLDLASENGRALAEHAGVMFPPGVLLDGEAFSYGRLSERKLRKELKRRGVERGINV